MLSKMYLYLLHQSVSLELKTTLHQSPASQLLNSTFLTHITAAPVLINY